MKCEFYVHFAAETWKIGGKKRVKSVKAKKLTQNGLPTNLAPYVVRFEVDIPEGNLLPAVAVHQLAEDDAVKVLKAIHDDLKKS